MASTHSAIHIHVVFSTKNREPHLMPSIRTRLHEYIGGIVNSEGAISNGVGGYHDHIHILVGIRPAQSLAHLIRAVKASSSGWAKRELGMQGFAWQEGYGAFSLSAKDLERARTYVANQEEHHRTQTFKEEYLGLLDRGMVEYNKKYLW